MVPIFALSAIAWSDGARRTARVGATHIVSALRITLDRRGMSRASHACRYRLARIGALYDELGELTPSPVVELNRAAALAMAFDPGAGVERIDALVAEGAFEEYPHLAATRKTGK